MWFDDFRKDGTLAIRRLVRSPTFTLAFVLTLALSIGAISTVFVVLQRVVLNPLPYPDSNRLIVLDHAARAEGIPRSRLGPWMTLGLYYHYTERARTLESVAIYRTEEQTLTGDSRPERVRLVRTTPSLASVLRVRPGRGRWFREDEAVPGAAQVAVLSHGLWMRRYDGSPEVIGTSIVLSGLTAQIVGVMPAGFAFPDSGIDIWMPDHLSRSTGFGVFRYYGTARLRDGATIEDSRTELDDLIADLPRAYPGVPLALAFVERIRLMSAAITLKDAIVGDVTRALWIVFVSMGILLLVACANIANLLLVRFEARQREVAVRWALGARGFAKIRFFFAESAVLSVAGAVIGLVLAWAAVRLLVAFHPADLPRLEEVRLDAISVLFTLAVMTIVSIILGTVPLWRGGFATTWLHETGRGNTGNRARHYSRNILMGCQVALALVLLISSGLVVRSFQKLRAIDPGYDAASSLTFRIALAAADYPTRDAAVTAHQAILDLLHALPGVKAVSAADCHPLSVLGYCFGGSLQVEGNDIPEGVIPPPAGIRAVAGQYMEAMRMPLLRGRSITRGDVDHRELVAVANVALVKAYFEDGDPIGKRVALALGIIGDQKKASPPVWLTVVGVVPDTPVLALAETSRLPMLYVPMSIAGGPNLPRTAGPNVANMSYVVRSDTSPMALLPAVWSVVDGVDSNLAIAQVGTLKGTLDRASSQMALTMAVLSVAAAIALILSVIGICGVISYIVSQRRAEIGIRLALGAQPAGVVGMIVRQGGVVVLVGLIVGLTAAFTGSRLIASMLYGVSPQDPIVFGGMSIAVLTIAILACWLPARRAAQLSPVEALRVD